LSPGHESTAGRPGTDLAARLTDPALYSGDPHPLYTRLRAEAPVAWNEELGFWAVSRHGDVCAVEHDAGTFCAGRGILVDEIGVRYASPPTMMHSDPPEHTRYRRLVQPGFKPTVVRALEPVVRARVAALVGALEPHECVDVLPALSVPLPLQVIGEILGLPESDWERAYEWSEAVIPGARPDWPEERRNALMAEMLTYLVDASKQRRAEPRDDVLTALAAAEIEGDQLSDDELGMFLVQLLVAGNETTRNLIAAGLIAFAEHPDQWQRLRAQRSLVPSAVEELLRWTTPVISFMRTATRDTELAGVEIAGGEPVLMLFASADRDEAVFGPTASTLDVGRSPNPHIAFGFGNHFCLGAALARLEGRAVLEALAERFAGIEVAGAVERSPSSVIAGVRRAELCFVPG
jgi:cytochrome P450